MKRLIFVTILGFLLFPFISLAAGGVYSLEAGGVNYTVTYDGIAPCGRCADVVPNAPASLVGECDQEIAGNPVPIGSPVSRKYIHCTLCHTFVMIDGIIDFFLLKIVPPLATLILIFGAIALYQAGTSPEKLNTAKSILMSAIIGLVIIYTSWIIINTVLQAVGILDWVGFGEGWFQITCEIKAKLW